MPLDNYATCQYNGVSFEGLYKSSVSSRPVFDEARRVTVGVEHTLTIKGHVVQGPTGPTLAQLRRSLTQPGGALLYTEAGFGDLVVNNPAAVNGVRDLAWGPHPEVMDWEPMGGEGGMAARITFVVRTTIPECDTARYQFALAAWNYDLAFDIDSDGYTTVRVSGYIEIPMTRITVSNRRLPDNVDRYRELLQSAVPLGFQRGNQSFRVSKDKRRLDYSYTDTEIPAPLPPYATRVDSTHAVDTSLQRGFRVWNVSLDATITMARGIAKRSALDVFLQLNGSRLAGLVSRAGRPIQMMEQTFSVSDRIFGRETSFRYSYHVVFPGVVGEFLAASGLWTAVPGNTYSVWRASLDAAGVNGVRGYAGVRANASDDALVDLCLDEAPVRPGGFTNWVLSPPARGGGSTDGRAPAPPTPPQRVDDRLTPPRGPTPPRSSWLAYEISLKLIREPGTSIRTLLPTRPPKGTRTGPLGGGAGGGGGWVPPPLDDNQAIALGPSGSASSADTAANAVGDPWPDPVRNNWPPRSFQSTVPPRYLLLMKGYAVRIGHRIPVPELREAGGQPTVEMGREVDEQVIGVTTRGERVYAVIFYIWYALPDAPTRPLPVPPNPFLGTPGTP